MHLVVDSTGLKIFGEGEWPEEKHKTKRKRRSWRKLHLGFDLVSGEIVCTDLTTDDVGDSTALPGRLDQVDGAVDLFLADGAFNADRRKSDTDKSVEQPLRQRVGLKPDAFYGPGLIFQDCNKIIKVADNHQLVANFTGFIGDAHRSLFHRDVQSGIVFHAVLPFLMLLAVLYRPRSIINSMRSTLPRITATGDGAEAEYPIEQRLSG